MATILPEHAHLQRCTLTTLAYHLIVIKKALAIFGAVLVGLALMVANPIQLVHANDSIFIIIENNSLHPIQMKTHIEHPQPTKPL